MTKRDYSKRPQNQYKEWIANFDYILNENNFYKILEGKFENKKQESIFEENKHDWLKQMKEAKGEL